MTMSDSSVHWLEVEIRKLRKKLRQIEHLERIDRILTDEEKIKVGKKDVIRSCLQELLQRLPPPSSSTDETDDELSTTNGESSLSSPTPQSSFLNKSFINSASPPPSLLQPNAEEAETFSPDSVLADSTQIDDNNERVVDSSSEVTPTFIKDSTPDLVNNSAREQKPSREKNVPSRNIANSSATKKSSENKNSLQQEWKRKCFSVISLQGHQDLVTCVSARDNFLASGSRDTTVKVWDLTTLSELRSLGSHTEKVTSILILDEIESSLLIKSFSAKYSDQSVNNSLDSSSMIDICQLVESDRVLLSASNDCCIKVWCLQSGCCLNSLYTYNPVTCLAYFDLSVVRLAHLRENSSNQEALNEVNHGQIVSASAGGKIELWDAVSGENKHSGIAHDDLISCIQVVNQYVVSGSVSGLVSVHELRGHALHRIFTSEFLSSSPSSAPADVTCDDGDDASPERKRGSAVRCLCTDARLDSVFYGDEGVNLKVLNWKNATLKKLTNHLGEYGYTDAVIQAGPVLLSTGYDLDTGSGYINVRDFSELTYLATLSDSATGRIVAMDGTMHPVGSGDPSELVIVTGGCELNVWRQNSHPPGKRIGVHRDAKVNFNAKFERRAKHSDIEDESLGDESSDTDYSDNEPDTESGQSSSYFTSWCQLI